MLMRQLQRLLKGCSALLMCSSCIRIPGVNNLEAEVVDSSEEATLVAHAQGDACGHATK
jgi:hypothetical protein